VTDAGGASKVTREARPGSARMNMSIPPGPT
jgi:hypothetical protein